MQTVISAYTDMAQGRQVRVFSHVILPDGTSASLPDRDLDYATLQARAEARGATTFTRDDIAAEVGGTFEVLPTPGAV